MWLFNYAETKMELYDMIKWINAVLKPGGSLVALGPTIENLEDLHNGTVKDDLRFNDRYIFGEQKGEGLFVERMGQPTVDFDTYLWTHNTYGTLFEISGFDTVRFLGEDDFRIDAKTCSTEKDIERQAMFWEYMNWKG